MTITGDSSFGLARIGRGSGCTGGGAVFSIYSANASGDSDRGLRLGGTGEGETGLGRGWG